MKKRNLAILAVTAVGFGAFVLHELRQDLSRIERGEHVASVSWLPADASDISYYASYLNTAAEFRISEQNFKKWCDGKGYSLQPIGATPFIIVRYSFSDAIRKPVTTAKLGDEEEYRLRIQMEKEMHQTIRRGLFYQKEFGNGGGIWAAFDADNQMAYFATSPR